MGRESHSPLGSTDGRMCVYLVRQGREGGRREEMCEAIIWYYPRSKVAGCGSLYPLERAMENTA